MAENRYKEHFVAMPVERHHTAAWANINKTRSDSNITIPDELEVGNAKEWVDTNEK